MAKVVCSNCRVFGCWTAGSGQSDCSRCGGSGMVGDEECEKCQGTGRQDCPVCDGSGLVDDD